MLFASQRVRFSNGWFFNGSILKVYKTVSSALIWVSFNFSFASVSPLLSIYFESYVFLYNSLFLFVKLAYFRSCFSYNCSVKIANTCCLLAYLLVAAMPACLLLQKRDIYSRLKITSFEHSISKIHLFTKSISKNAISEKAISFFCLWKYQLSLCSIFTGI